MKFNACTSYLYFERQGLSTSGLWLLDLRGQPARDAFQASAASQIGSHVRTGAFPRLVPWAADGEDHVRQSLQVKKLHLQYADAAFRIVLIRLRGLSSSWVRDKCERRALLRHFRRKTKQLQTLTQRLLVIMPGHIASFLGSLNVAFVLYRQVLLRWPDVAYAVRFLQGGRIVELLDLSIFGLPSQPQTSSTPASCCKTLIPIWTNWNAGQNPL